MLSTPSSYSIAPAKDAPLRFLSVVDVALLPLHILLGQQYNVTTNDVSAQQYLERVLLGCPKETEAWWKTFRPESPLGILVAVEGDGRTSKDLPQITELLFVASQAPTIHGQRLSTPPASSPFEHAGNTNGAGEQSLHVIAFPICSAFLDSANLPSPPLSPIPDNVDTIPATFLPPLIPQPTETIHEPPTKKRRTATSTLDEATARRAAARRGGGESISAAAAAKPDAHQRRPSSNTPLQTRPLSRSPSISSSRPGSVRGNHPLEKQPSTLSRVQSLSALPAEPSPEDSAAAATESKNKDTIARVVMAGMRLYGLSQSTRKLLRNKQRTGSQSPLPPEENASPEELAAERKNDEEYKAVYHQVHKGVCFAFRSYMHTLPLQGYTDALRETADKLLAMFCSDPLAQGLLGGGEQKFTPGGRKAFGSAKVEEEGKSPFAGAKGGMGRM